jgi:hypothetical protein
VSVSPLRAAAAALLAVLLAGCGDSSTPAAAPSTASAASTTSAAAPTSPTPTAAPTVAAAPGPAVKPAPAKLLPWPTTDPARLQAAVDGGASPWLLDPTDLALSYVTAAYNWTAADAAPAAGTAAATKVDVRNTDGKRRTLTVAQPSRKGNGGIWVVTADSTG